MKYTFMISRLSVAAFASMIALSSSARAQEFYSQIVGAISIDLPAESDVIVAFPFKQSAEFRGVLESATENGNVTLTVAADSLTSGAFDSQSGVPTHYVVIETGTQKGTHLDVTSNSASGIVLSGGTSAGLANGDEIAIYPHWTLSSAFPLGVANEDESEPGVRKIEVIVPESASEEGDMIPEGIYYFSGGSWRQVEAGIDAVVDNTVLYPGRALVIRNNDTVGKNALFFGEVIDAPIVIPLSESDQFASDNFIGLNRPLAIALNELGLAPGGVFEETTDPDNPNDLLLVYSLTETGKNKKPVAEYFYYNGAWREASAGASIDRGTDTIQPGMGLAVRKVKVDANPEDANWVNEWSLPQ
ncbi:MAG TPA: hypothetical protein DIV79_10425 [Opitutae bacterium]|nr:hypothetical protein [Opitutaceae bacterium]HCR30420.1 hypothetical protein [Opitutae bacterium]